MPTFIGFSTIDNNNNCGTLVDSALIRRDLLNALNIQQGSIPGRPGYGTTLWGFLFEPQTPETQTGIVNELQRVIGGDPRLVLISAQPYPQQNGLLLEIEVQLVSSTTAERLSIFFDIQSRRASFV